MKNNFFKIALIVLIGIISIGAVTFYRLQNVVEDLTPQLGGDLDGQSTYDVVNMIDGEFEGLLNVGKNTNCNGYFLSDSYEIQTTDETITTLITLPLEDENTYNVEAIVIGIQSDGSNRGSYYIAGTYYRTGEGSATVQGSTTSLHIDESDASWGAVQNDGAAITVSGNNVIVNVEGKADTTINWSGFIKYFNMGN